MKSIDKFLGIPRKDGAVSYDGTDCIGICILFWKEHGLSLPFNSVMLDENIPNMMQFLRNFQVIYDIRNANTLSKCDNLNYGDLLHIYMGHWGICLTEELFLTCTDETKIFDLRKLRIGRRLYSIFRPKMPMGKTYLLSGTEKINILSD